MLKNKRYFAGIDVGTSNVKGAIYSTDGDMIASSLRHYDSHTPEANHHEQDPDDWIAGFKTVLADLCKASGDAGSKLVSLSLSTQGGTVVTLGKDSRPLYPAITWLDRRGEDILKSQKELAGKNLWFYDRTGWRLDSNLSFMPMYWLKEKRPDIFRRVHKVLYVNDFMLREITGTNMQDPSNASITLFYNVSKGRWDEDILDLIGLKADNFSEVFASGVPVGYLKKEICEAAGISSKVMVVNGGHDQYCASLGAGIVNEEEILLATGTAWVTFKLLKEPVFDIKRLFAIGRHVLKDRFGLIYSIPCAGASLDWFASSFLGVKAKRLFETIDNNRDVISSRKNRILFYPYLTGDFGPDFDIGKKASFSNLELGHDRFDLLKAMMEGVAFQFRKILEVMAERGISTERIKMAGGASKSSLWPQILSDVTSMEILLPKDHEDDLAVRGAAILAGVGAGLFSSITEGIRKMDPGFISIKPSVDKGYYEEKYLSF